jgi:hypothetical protein
VCAAVKAAAAAGEAVHALVIGRDPESMPIAKSNSNDAV